MKRGVEIVHRHHRRHARRRHLAHQIELRRLVEREQFARARFIIVNQVGGVDRAGQQVQRFERAEQFARHHETVVADQRLFLRVFFRQKTPAARPQQFLQRPQQIGGVVERELLLHEGGVGEDVALPLGQRAPPRGIGPGDDAVAPLDVDFLARLDTIPDFFS